MIRICIHFFKHRPEWKFIINSTCDFLMMLRIKMTHNMNEQYVTKVPNLFMRAYVPKIRNNLLRVADLLDIFPQMRNFLNLLFLRNFYTRKLLKVIFYRNENLSLKKIFLNCSVLFNVIFFIIVSRARLILLGVVTVTDLPLGIIRKLIK